MSVKSIFWLVVFLAAGVSSLLWGVRDVFELLRVQRVWDSGLVAPSASYEVEEVLALGVPLMGYAGAVAWSFDLNVTYRTRDGEEESAKGRFFRIGGAKSFTDDPHRAFEDTTFRGGREPFAVRYLEGSPEEAALSWAYHASATGWVRAILLILIALGLFSVVGRYLFAKGDVVIDLE